MRRPEADRAARSRPSLHGGAHRSHRRRPPKRASTVARSRSARAARPNRRTASKPVYTVKRGDTLASIARLFKTTSRRCKSWNPQLPGSRLTRRRAHHRLPAHELAPSPRRSLRTAASAYPDVPRRTRRSAESAASATCFHSQSADSLITRLMRRALALARRRAGVPAHRGGLRRRARPFTSKSTCRSASHRSRWSACRTRASARAAIASAARSGIPASSFRRIGSPSISRRPTCARRARRSTCRSRSASSRRRASCAAAHIPDLVLLGELSLDGAIQATRGVLPIAAAARRDGAARHAAAARQRRRSRGRRRA